MLEKGTIVQGKQSNAFFSNNIFVVPKFSKGFRPVINFKCEYRFVDALHLKMEGNKIIVTNNF